MNKELKSTLKTFCIELVIYAAFVAAYFFLVLHFLTNWLTRLFEHERHLYAIVALGLIIGQGFLLELCTRLMMIWIKPTTEER